MHPKIVIIALLSICALGTWAGEEMPAFRMPKVKEPAIPKRVMRITDFGAVPDGKTLNTEAIAKAISTLAEKGGGRLVFPAGLWLTGPISLKSRIELHLEEGALLKFTDDLSQYPDWTIKIKDEKEKTKASPINGENLEDVAITGRGVVDGTGEAWRPVKRSKVTESQWKQLVGSGGILFERGGEDIWWPFKPGREDVRPRLVRLVNCHRVLLEGVTFQNSPGWNLNPTLCEDVTLRNVTVRNPWYSQNGDGLDLEYCRNVVVRDSRFDVGDDAICLKSGLNERGRRINVPTENVLVENCVVYHGHGGVTIGSEMSGGVRNVRVDNCTFIGTDLGLRFKSTRGRGGVVEKIYISNVRMTDIPTDAIGFNMYYGGHAPTEAPNHPVETGAANTPAVDEGTPQFRDIYIQNVICRGARRAVALQGLPEMPIRGIHLRNISITSDRGIECRDAEDIALEHVEILNTTGPVLTFSNARNVRVDGLSHGAKTGPVILANGRENGGIVIRNTDVKEDGQGIGLAGGATRAAFDIK